MSGGGSFLGGDFSKTGVPFSGDPVKYSSKSRWRAGRIFWNILSNKILGVSRVGVRFSSHSLLSPHLVIADIIFQVKILLSREIFSGCSNIFSAIFSSRSWNIFPSVKLQLSDITFLVQTYRIKYSKYI